MYLEASQKLTSSPLYAFLRALFVDKHKVGQKWYIRQTLPASAIYNESDRTCSSYPAEPYIYIKAAGHWKGYPPAHHLPTASNPLAG